MAASLEATLVLARSGPGTTGARRGLDLCARLAAGGRRVTLALLADAVLLAPEAAASDAEVVYLAEDAAMRGLGPEELGGARGIDHGELVDLMMAAGRVLGSF